MSRCNCYDCADSRKSARERKAARETTIDDFVHLSTTADIWAEPEFDREPDWHELVDGDWLDDYGWGHPEPLRVSLLELAR